MKKILILGADGMAGSMISHYLSLFYLHYTIETTARNSAYIAPTYFIDINTNLDTLKSIISNGKYDVIINCIGVLIKTSKDNPSMAMHINGYFPHWLEAKTDHTKTKVIHLSTDCVFSGKKGQYTEKDFPDETNVYGKSKSLGELNNAKDLTLRLSIIGPELNPDGVGLFNWFLKQKNTIMGYAKVYWSGITTLELAKNIHRVLQRCPTLSGLYHLAPNFNINKNDLLTLMNSAFARNLRIISKDKPKENKTLINNRTKEYWPNIPRYGAQLIELKNFIERYYEK